MLKNKKSTIFSKQKGFILTTFAIFTSVIAAVSVLGYGIKNNSNIISSYLDKKLAKHNALIVEEKALKIIKEYKNDYPSILLERLKDIPSNINLYTLSIGKVDIYLADQNSLFNLNWLINTNATDNNQRHSMLMNILKNMLSLCNIDTQVADQLNDTINNTNIDDTKIFLNLCDTILDSISIENQQFPIKQIFYF